MMRFPFASALHTAPTVLTCSQADDEGVLCRHEELRGQDSAANQHLALAHGELVDGQLDYLVVCGTWVQAGRVEGRGWEGGAVERTSSLLSTSAKGLVVEPEQLRPCLLRSNQPTYTSKAL